ncbi:sacsin [Pyrus ussuriensis x Pyrus communis]|uniref:Sacsin n=1 Tax=Pyrus ussuriensis x Pyrus communis TaxID=2448454 RepID=A0A5N5FG52_9ROSA|nr:sacsin [Pyrus ussuriensis x Pyrus communis]
MLSLSPATTSPKPLYSSSNLRFVVPVKFFVRYHVSDSESKIWMSKSGHRLPSFNDFGAIAKPRAPGI